MPVGLFGGARVRRVDHYNARAGTPGFFDEVPQVQVGDDGIGAPEHDVAAVHDFLRHDPERSAVRGGYPSEAGAAADGANEPCSAEPVEEALAHGIALDQPLGAEVGVGEYRRCAVTCHDFLQARGDWVERGVPAHALEPAGPFGPDAAQRMEQALRAVHALDVVIDLGAQPAAGERMVRVALQGDGATVLDADPPGAGVGTVVRTGSLDNADGRIAPRASGHRVTSRSVALSARRYRSTKTRGGVLSLSGPPGRGRTPDPCHRGGLEVFSGSSAHSRISRLQIRAYALYWRPCSQASAPRIRPHRQQAGPAAARASGCAG